MNDLRVAWRGLAKTKGFAFAAVSCLALALGLVAGVTAVAVGALRPALPYPSSHELVQLDESGVFPVPAGGRFDVGPRITRDVFDAIRREPVLAGIGEYSFNPAAIDGDHQTTHDSYALSSQLLSVLGVRPALGRWFAPDEDIRGRGNVVILNHSFWLRRFGGDSAVVGERINLVVGHGKVPHTIIGVMPARFSFPAGLEPDFYLPYGSEATRQLPTPRVVARLAPGVTRERAQALLQTIVDRHAETDRAIARADIARYNAAKNTGRTLRAPTGPVKAKVRDYTHEVASDQSTEQVVRLILMATMCVLLLAAVNVSNLLFARGHARRVEIAVRLALGASRRRVIRLLLAESVLLAGGGVMVGVALGWTISTFLIPAFPNTAVRPIVDGRTVLATSVVGVMLIGAFGVIPALRVSDLHLDRVLRDSSRTGFATWRFESVVSRLLVLSTAVTMLLSVGTGLIATGVLSALGEMRGAGLKDVAALQLEVRDNAQALELLRRVSSIPGVVSAAYGDPPSNVSLTATTAEREDGKQIPLGYANISFASSDYFRVIGVPVIAGNAAESQTHAVPRSLVIDEQTAIRIWQSSHPVGRRLRLRLNNDSIGNDFVVSGLVRARRVLVRESAEARPGSLYVPYDASLRPNTWLLVRTTNERRDGINRRLRAVAGDVAGIHIIDFAFLGELQARRNVFTRIIGSAFGVFAIVSLLLIVLGLYALVAYSAERRRHELGVRLAVGATRANIIGLLVRSTMSLSLIGVGIGALLSFAMNPLLRGVTNGLPVSVPVVYGAAAALILIASGVASWAGARGAARSDPVAILRAD